MAPEQTSADLHTVSTPDYTGVTIRSANGFRSLAVAEINTVSPLEFWVARVLVRDETDRGKGLGSRVLQRAIELVVEQTGGIGRITVAPGGYNNDPERQRRFYEKNGFRLVNKEGLMEWRAT